MMVVFGESDHIALAGDLKATATRDLDIRALELGDEVAFGREYGHVEAVAVRVADEHVALVRDVDAVREVGDVLAADSAHEAAVFVEHDDAVAFEVAHVVLVAPDGDVRWLAHVVRAVEPF